MKFDKEMIDDIVVIKIDGEIEKNDELVLKEYFEELIEVKNIKKIVVDASKIQYLGSSTLGIFSKINQNIGKKGGTLIFASLSHFVKKIFKITTFDKYFNIKYNVKDAINELKR